MTRSRRVVVGVAIVGVALTGSGCLTTALVGLCISGCGAGCVGALGTCPIADERDAPPPRPVGALGPRSPEGGGGLPEPDPRTGEEHR